MGCGRDGLRLIGGNFMFDFGMKLPDFLCRSLVIATISCLQWENKIKAICSWLRHGDELIDLRHEAFHY
jgi:hypothetical protein